MDRQRYRNGEDAAQVLNELRFPVLRVDIRVQRFYQEVIEKAPNRAQSDDQNGPPQAIGSRQVRLC